MTDTQGLRLLLAARKSRKVAGDTALYERQDSKAHDWAKREGHAVIHTTMDTKSGTTAPWSRKQLKPWMSDPTLLAEYDALLVSELDRLSRGTDEDFHYIERWCYDNGKRIVVADGPQFPPRTDAMGEADRYNWVAMKRAARAYWESVRDKHADTRKIVRANGALTGGATPYGYMITGDKLHKGYVASPDESRTVESFERIAAGDTATAVTRWLGFANVKRTIDMIRNTAYLPDDNKMCHRDSHAYAPLPGMTQELWQQANAVLDGRYVRHGRNAADTSFTGCIYCGNCGTVLYRHQSTKNGVPTGTEKYLCSRGRKGATSETKCGMPTLVASDVNAMLDTAMRGLTHLRETITVTTGGSHAKDAELDKLNKLLAEATAAGDMTRVIELAGQIQAVQTSPDTPLEVSHIYGKTYSELWINGDHAERRSLLARGGLRMVATQTEVHIDYYAAASDDH